MAEYTKNTTTGNGGVRGAKRSAALAALASTLMDRFNFAQSAGLSFKDTTGSYRRDMYDALGYDRDLEPQLYRARYERGGIAERIVEAYPRATWGGGATIQEDPDPENITAFEEVMIDVFSRLDLWARVLRADILSGLGQYGVLLLGVEGNLVDELPATGSDDGTRLLFVQPLGQDRATIEKMVTDTENPRFGLPEFYKLSLSSDGQDKRVHWSRVIHVAEGTLEDDLLGKPRLRAVWNYLDDLAKLVGGGAEAAWKRMDPGIQMDLDPEAQLSTEDEAKLSDEIDEWIHNMRRVARTRGVKLTQLATSAANFGPNSDTVIQLISATTGIPYRILTGSERGELASTQDRNNWNDRISERRREFAVPLIIDIVERLITYRIVPEPVEPYEIVWPDSEELNELEKADLAVKLATANKTQVEAAGGLLMTNEEIRDQVLGLGPLDDVQEEDDEEPVEDVPPDEEPPTGNRRLAADLADRDRDEPEWKAIHRAADMYRATMASAIVSMWDRARREIDWERFKDLVARPDFRGSEDVVLAPFESDAAVEGMTAIIQRCLVAGAEASLRSVRSRGTWLRGAKIVMDFDSTAPRVIQWARREGSTLIVEINDKIRENVRSLISKGIRTGIPPYKLAASIQMKVDLHTRWADAVDNLERRMRDRTNWGKTIQAGKTKVRVPSGGPSDSLVEQRTAQYARRLRRKRAEWIARTETVRAANEGQRQLWNQAIEQNQLQPDAQREWIATGDSRTRPEHAERDGVRVGINESWPWGTEPGEEPLCRCGQGIAPTAYGSGGTPPPGTPSRDFAFAPELRSHSQILKEIGYKGYKNSTPVERFNAAKNMLYQMADDYNIPRGSITFDAGGDFIVAGREYTMAGGYEYYSGKVSFSRAMLQSGRMKEVAGLAHHEFQHHIYEKTLRRWLHASNELRDKLGPRYKALWQRMFRSYERGVEEFVKADGVTSYSKAYWREWKTTGSSGDLDTAFDETLAEISRLMQTGTTAQKAKIDTMWREVYEEMRSLYYGTGG